MSGYQLMGTVAALESETQLGSLNWEAYKLRGAAPERLNPKQFRALGLVSGLGFRVYR